MFPVEEWLEAHCPNVRDHLSSRHPEDFFLAYGLYPLEHYQEKGPQFGDTIDRGFGQKNRVFF